jgi:hypothetical protein
MNRFFVKKYKYNLVQPPYKLDFSLMDRNQAREFFTWYKSQIPLRVDELTRYVNATPGFENWKADYSPNSLDLLGEWFYRKIETRQQSEQENAGKFAIIAFWFRQFLMVDDDLSFFTLSLCIDVGMYMAQVLLGNVDGLRWGMIKSPKSNVDFQRPVLQGRKKMAFSPIQLITVYAYGVISGTKKPRDLRDLYDTWAYILQD